MGILHNTGVTNDGLVFGYDTGVGVNNNEIGTRFYPGEPTTNLQSSNQSTNQLFGMQGVTVSYVGEEDGYSKYSMNGTFSAGTYPYCMYLPGVSFTGGVKYSTQAKIKTNVSHKFNYFGATGVSYVNQPMDHSGTVSSVLKDDGCYLVKREGFAYTSTTTQPGYLFTNPINNTTFSSSSDFVFIKNFQIEQNDHCTPHTLTSRSNTTSLIDLKRGVNIDVSSVSFNSTGQPDFDGTDDKGVVTNFPHIWADSVTMECVVKFEDDGRSIIFGNYNVSANDVNFEKLTNGVLRFYWNRGERDITSSSGVVTTNGSSYHHCVFVRDVYNNCFKFYVDGILVNTISNAGTNITFTSNSGFTMPSGHNTFRFGGDTRNGDTIHNGEIPIIRLYNRCLKADEVTRNFNAYKNRFNL